jgi:hypothetical protein
MKRVVTLAAVSVLLGLVAHFGIFYFLKFQGPAPRERPDFDSEIEYVGNLARESDPVLQEQGLLYDSAPLFMPTRWNLGSEMGSVASLREATEVFAIFPPELSLPDSPPQIRDSIKGAPPMPLQELPQGPAFIMAPFGRVSANSGESSPASMIVEARPLDSQRVADSVRIPIPESLIQQVPPSLWSPARLHLQLKEGRPIGWPVVASGSGFTEWDEALQQYVGSLGFYRYLRNGYYLITVYP